MSLSRRLTKGALEKVVKKSAIGSPSNVDRLLRAGASNVNDSERLLKIKATTQIFASKKDMTASATQYPIEKHKHLTPNGAPPRRMAEAWSAGVTFRLSGS
jgi:hypothetical protein